MELQQAIANRRSVKKFKRDMHIDNALLYQAIEKAADAPNHGTEGTMESCACSERQIRRYE